MSELSAKLADLKGSKTTSEIIQKAGLSRETFRKMERGEGVKLSTLRQIFDAFERPEADQEEEWIELLIAWIKTEIGGEAAKLYISSLRPGRMRESQPDMTAQAMTAFQNLNHADRLQILKTMQRRTVLNCLPAINQVWEKTDQAKPKRTKGPSRFEILEEVVEEQQSSPKSGQ